MDDPKTEKEILDAIRRQLPVGYIPTHTTAALPEMVMYHVQRSALLGALADECDAILRREDCGLKDFIRFMNRLCKANEENKIS